MVQFGPFSWPRSPSPGQTHPPPGAQSPRPAGPAAQAAGMAPAHQTPRCQT